MNKRQIELTAFAVIGIAILAVWGWQALKPESPKTEEAALKTPEVRETKIGEETPDYRVKASYPEFRNLGDSARERAANNSVKQKVEQSIDSFKAAVRDTEDFIPEAKSEIEIKYEVFYLSPSVASIRISEYSYIEGAAHPLSIYWTFNYNFKDKREIALADFFTPGSNYLSVLSKLSRENLKTQLKENYIQEAVEFGTTPTAENFSVFLLDKDKLTIIFNVYSVASYAAGTRKVEIPYGNLSDIINQEGLVKLIRD